MVLAVLASVASAVWAAGCREDCALGLQSAVQACEDNYSEDPKNLADCRENAQREYQACLEDCRG